MRILINTNTGKCIGFGNDEQWIGLSYAFPAPAWITLENFANWTCTNLNDINNIANWVEQTPVETLAEIVGRERIFCFSLQDKILVKLREENLTNTQRGTLLNTVQTAMNSLGWGDPQVSRAAFNQIATTALWTQARKDWVLLQLDTYLNG